MKKATDNLIMAFGVVSFGAVCLCRGIKDWADLPINLIVAAGVLLSAFAVSSVISLIREKFEKPH